MSDRTVVTSYVHEDPFVGAVDRELLDDPFAFVASGVSELVGVTARSAGRRPVNLAGSCAGSGLPSGYRAVSLLDPGDGVEGLIPGRRFTCIGHHQDR